MTRSPRRASRIRTSPKGRLAATPPLGAGLTPRMVVRQRPAIRGRRCPPLECQELHPSWRAFYLRWAEVFRVLDRPFKWALLVGGLVLLAFVVGLLI